ncbi:MAG: glycosyltransferase family 1 protein [Parcubacteria group bacterium]|jgi:glycosyltransferase involved in cell wall biosynthesis
MRIGINASFVRKPNTGIGQVSINFLKKLIENHESGIMNHEFVLYLEEDLPEDIKLPENFKKEIFLPFWKRDDLIRKIWWEKMLLPKKVTQGKCDVLVSLYHSPTILSDATFHIMLVHDIIPELFPEYINNCRKKKYWKLTKKAILEADKIMAVSSRTEKDLIQHLGVEPERISVNYPDADEIYKKEVFEEKSKKVLGKYGLKSGYILGGGGLEVRKNTERLIRAYHKLLESNKRTHFIKDLPKLVISGKLMPELKPLVTDVEKLVKELNLTGQVKLLDFVPQEDLPVLYKNALVFVYPSLYEGFGLPVLEAMNQGIPVITSKNSSLPEVGGDSVLYCHPEDIQDIAMVMRNVILHGHLRDELRRRGKDRAQKFSWDNFVEKLFNVIENLK